MVKDFPDTKELLEYEDYKAKTTRASAAEFIAQAYEQFIVPMDQRENYIDYVANRPGAQQQSGCGLWDANSPVSSLHQVEENVSRHAGNVWTPIVSLRREDAEQNGHAYAEFFMKRMERGEQRPLSVMLATTKLLYHMGNIFRDHAPATPTAGGIQIDRKRWAELQEKRVALGHAPDDHEDELNYKYMEPSM